MVAARLSSCWRFSGSRRTENVSFSGIVVLPCSFGCNCVQNAMRGEQLQAGFVSENFRISAPKGAGQAGSRRWASAQRRRAPSRSPVSSRARPIQNWVDAWSSRGASSVSLRAAPSRLVREMHFTDSTPAYPRRKVPFPAMTSPQPKRKGCHPSGRNEVEDVRSTLPPWSGGYAALRFHPQILRKTQIPTVVRDRQHTASDHGRDRASLVTEASFLTTP